MNANCSIVITSIAGPDNPVLRRFARECADNAASFIIIGDAKSPQGFYLENSDFWSLDRQRKLPFALARLLPEKTYSRKNLGYLVAMWNNAEVIVETDDDNVPQDGFWNERRRAVSARVIENAGWVNVYRYFSPHHLWPRGFALEELRRTRDADPSFDLREVDAPIQQGLTDKNPDVDALYRLTRPLPVTFNSAPPVALGACSWCPFNSQNTTWFREAFPLLYLPSSCSFRMTDIWRGFIAQRIAWACGWHLAFCGATTYQERNEHDLLNDFRDEVVGYLNNGRIAGDLQTLDLAAGVDAIGDNLVACYAMMVRNGYVGSEEMKLLGAWLDDCREVGKSARFGLFGRAR
jgi:hypothetical protein